MDTPAIRYAVTSDEVHIAYWAVGSGPVVVQLPGLPHSHIQMEWEQPEWRRGYELAATATTWVRYDGRGTGLSERNVHDFSGEALLADLEAVVDALGAEQVGLYGVVNTCPVAIAYAVKHPEKVARMMLWIPVVDGSVHKANPMLESARRIVLTDWETFSETVAHGLLGWGETELARRYAKIIRAGIDQETILPMVEQLHALNVWDLLPQVRCPTLVLHRPALKMLPPGTAERVAATIPGATLALFDGSASAPYVGDWRAITRVVAEFLGVQVERLPQQGTRALRLLSMKTDELTQRELEVVELVAQGLTNHEIASQLVLAEKTVEHHVSRVLAKLNLKTRTQIAAYAVQHGLGGKTAS